LVASRINNGHGGLLVACPITDIMFLFRGHAQHSTVCYNVKMARERSDLPSWLVGCHGWRTPPPLMAVVDRHKHVGRGSGRRAGRLAGDSSVFRREYGVNERVRHGEGDVGVI
jgi:hypothetical protein